MRRVAAVILTAIGLAALLAPIVSPHDPAARFTDHPHAPPTRVRLVHDGGLRPPFFYPQQLVNRLEERYVEDRAHPVPIAWFCGIL